MTGRANKYCHAAMTPAYAFWPTAAVFINIAICFGVNLFICTQCQKTMSTEGQTETASSCLRRATAIVLHYQRPRCQVVCPPQLSIGHPLATRSIASRQLHLLRSMRRWLKGLLHAQLLMWD